MRPKIYFSQSFEERLWHVWRPVVKMGEHHHEFFFYVDEKDADKRELIVPPKGLYGKEFLELDYRDPFQLMAFQRKWGPITGLRAQPNKTFDMGTYPNVAINDSFYGPGQHPIFHPEGIRKTVFLYDGFGEAETIARERYGTEVTTLGKVVHENWLKERKEQIPDVDVVPCHVASVEEVAEAVCDAQVAIRAITNTLRNDYSEEDWQRDRELVLESVRYCNAVLAGSVTPVDVIVDGSREGVCTLMQYLFISLAKGVMLNNAYRTCQNPECARIFSPKEYGRRMDSKYCSEECQVRAKYLRTFKHGQPKSLKQGASQNDFDDASIRVTWSTSNIPLRTIRRDQVRLPGDEHEAMQMDVAEQMLLALSFFGLTTGWVRTADILEDLKQRDLE